MGVFEKYFLIVNVVGFLIYFINYLLSLTSYVF